VHHAGNSSGIVDGAAAVLVIAKAAATSSARSPCARIRAVGLGASEPIIMLYGPVPAAQRALAKAGMKASDIDLYEVNEAFACVPMASWTSSASTPTGQRQRRRDRARATRSGPPARCC
jgi:acetyl-CoA C-acetyltransferase